MPEAVTETKSLDLTEAQLNFSEIFLDEIYQNPESFTQWLRKPGSFITEAQLLQILEILKKPDKSAANTADAKKNADIRNLYATQIATRYLYNLAAKYNHQTVMCLLSNLQDRNHKAQLIARFIPNVRPFQIAIYDKEAKTTPEQRAEHAYAWVVNQKANNDNDHIECFTGYIQIAFPDYATQEGFSDITNFYEDMKLFQLIDSNGIPTGEVNHSLLPGICSTLFPTSKFLQAKLFLACIENKPFQELGENFKDITKTFFQTLNPIAQLYLEKNIKCSEDELKYITEKTSLETKHPYPTLPKRTSLKQEQDSQWAGEKIQPHKISSGGLQVGS